MNAPIFIILLRWFHIIAAALAIGGLFYMRFILPAGLKNLPAESATEVVRGVRRVFKRVVHTCILLLIVSGTLNSIRLFPAYSAWPGVLHGVWGMHVLLALVAFGLAIWLTKGELPPLSHKKWAAVNIAALLALVAVAATLKHLRETAGPVKTPVTQPALK